LGFNPDFDHNQTMKASLRNAKENYISRGHYKIVRTVFHIAVDGLLRKPSEVQRGAQVVYLLRNMGAHINRQDQDGCTPLLRYLKCASAHPDVVEAFLRCNADVYITDKDGVYPLEVVTTSPTITDAVRDIFMKYVPGIWEAVEGDDAMNVRKLINEWCRVDVQKNGQTLLQLSLDIGTESIIRVVSGIRPSMEFAHCVLAGDVGTARKMLRLSQKLKLNINFRNMGDRGATPLFYALRQGNMAVVQLLLEYGARIDIMMKADAECDIPLYIAALETIPAIPTPLLKAITPNGPITVDCLFYKGKNVLFHCIDNDVDGALIEFILCKGSAYLVTQRIENNLCARDYADIHGCRKMVQAIDSAVSRWMFQEMGINREILVLQGYQYLPAPVKNSGDDVDSATDPFYKYLPLYQGDGQPLVHKAVLRGSYEMLELLAETLVYQHKQRLDSVRDQYFRTALHYAYGQEDGKQLVDLLLDYGASEFTMDRDSRSPLCFKDRRGQTLMRRLLEYQLRQDFRQPEPDPWSVPMPVPIIGYILSCSNGAHTPEDVTEKLAALPCSKSDLQKYRSLSDTKLHKISKSVNKSSTIASHLASLPDVVRTRMATRTYHKCLGMEKDYFPLPTDETYDEANENDEYSDEYGDAEGKDLLEEREFSKSPSCCIQ
ncbi:hypothetical protein BaRGS_00003436, partial [Batillaria attramentaria]